MTSRSDLALDPRTALREIEQGSRRALSRCLSLAESRNPEDSAWVASLLELRPENPATAACRIAFSGPPGAGKSSLIDRLGACALEEGLSVAVLAVDPSSEKSGGSLLADKTRMPILGAHSNAFVRPSPSKGELGGIIHTLPTSVRLCELAGYRRIFVETVGVGQSEADAADLVDCFVLVLAPGGGDELQGLKRGITEVCDCLVVNKVDADPAGALALKQAYESAFHLLRSAVPANLCVSALTGVGVPELWQQLSRSWEALTASGRLLGTRRQKTSRLFVRLAERELLRRLLLQPKMLTQLQQLSGALLEGSLTLDAALRQLVVPGE